MMQGGRDLTCKLLLSLSKLLRHQVDILLGELAQLRGSGLDQLLRAFLYSCLHRHDGQFPSFRLKNWLKYAFSKRLACQLSDQTEQRQVHRNDNTTDHHPQQQYDHRLHGSQQVGDG